MANNNKANPPAARVTPTPVARQEDDLPVFESIGLAKTPKGWVVVLQKTQGQRVLDTEILEGPAPRAIVSEALKIAVVRRLLFPKG